MQQLIVTMLIKVLIGTDIFEQVEKLVHRWAEGQLSGMEKRHGVLNEVKVMGIKASEWMVRLAIELAVGKLKGYR